MALPTNAEVFGKVDPKNAPGGEGLGFLNFGTGAAGLGKFLSAAIQLIFMLAGIALVFMILWGAWDWIVSGGEKDKVAAARNKITNAIIGMIILAVSFAIIGVLGQFLGFEFFKIPGA
jgi:hypothetical protein